MAAEWTVPAVARTDPDHVAAERTALEQWLDFHRDTLLGTCAGLTSEQLKQRAVPPSGLSLLGLVRRLADAAADLDTYRNEIVAARAAVAGKALDDVVPFPWGGPDRDVRWIFLHLIEEYARIDGRTGD